MERGGQESVSLDYRSENENVIIFWRGGEVNRTNKFILTIAERKKIVFEKEIDGSQIILSPSQGVMIGRTYDLTLRADVDGRGEYKKLCMQTTLLGGMVVPRDVSAVPHDVNSSRWIKVSFKTPEIWDEDTEYIIQGIPKGSGKTRVVSTSKTTGILKYLKSDEEYVIQVRAKTVDDCLKTTWSSAIASTSLATAPMASTSAFAVSGKAHKLVVNDSTILTNTTFYPRTPSENCGSVLNVRTLFIHEDELKRYYQVKWDVPNFDDRKHDFLIHFFNVHIRDVDGNAVPNPQIHYDIDRSSSSYSSEEVGLDFGRKYKIMVTTRYENVENGDIGTSRATEDTLETPATKKWTKKIVDEDGMFGPTMEAISGSGSSYVYRQISAGCMSPEENESIKKQMNGVRQLNHPHLLKYYAFYKKDRNFILTMESIQWCTLKTIVRRNGGLQEPEAAKYSDQILDGLTFLHNLNVCNVKIMCSAICWHETRGIKLYEYAFPKSLSNRLSLHLTSASGSEDLWDPHPDEAGKPADVWRVGCTIYEMLTAEPPWPKVRQQDREQLVYRCDSPEFPSNKFSDDSKEFLKLIFVPEGARSKISTLRKHHWIQRQKQSNVKEEDNAQGRQSLQPAPSRRSGVIVSDGLTSDERQLEKEYLEGTWNDEALIAKGGFSLVYQVTHEKFPGKKLAIKLLKEQEMTETNLEREIELSYMLRHNHIVKCYGYVMRPNFIGKREARCLVMEYMERTLSEEIQGENCGIPEYRAKKLTSQILSAISFLHKQGVAHRDLKPENILLDTEGNVKLADFGLAKKLQGYQPEMPSQRCIGTLFYMSPEALQWEVDGENVAKPIKIGRKTDIWSLGCIVYEMLTGWHLYRHEKRVTAYRLLQHIEKLGRPMPKNSSSHLQTFLLSTFEMNPEKRPSAEELSSYSWLVASTGI